MTNNFLSILQNKLNENKILRIDYFYSTHKFYCYVKNNSKNIPVNVLNNIEFNILNKKILSFSPFDNDSNNREHIIKKNYLEYKNEILYYKNIYKNDCVVRFYPNYKKIINNFNLYKKILYKKYFKISNEIDQKEESNLHYALEYLGINFKNINCIDLDFISALHKKWEFIVYNYYNIFLKILENNEILENLEEDEKQEYMEELKEFKSNKQINMFFDELKIKKTVKDIVSFWPDWLQPKPYFVYDN
jgi:hypothetical protein